MIGMKAIRLLVFTLLALLLLISCDKATKPEEVLIIYVNPLDGQYNLDSEITITCSHPDAVLRYTTNGAEPVTSSLQYNIPLLVQDILTPLTNNGILKVKAFKAGYLPSHTVSRTYTVTYPNTVSTPEMNPPLGTFPGGVSVTLSTATPDALIHYTLDGTEPGIMSPLYHQPIVITQSGTIYLKAKAFRQDYNPGSISIAEYFIPHIPPEMVLVESGSFNNGTADITLSSFYIDKHEVTQAEYYDVMQSIPPLISQGRGEYPVYYVSLLQALEYCNRRSLLEGFDPCYSNPIDIWKEGSFSAPNNVYCIWDANGYRLPTEMEWMFAAKGGNQSLGYLYSGSDIYYNVAWYDSISGYSVHPVMEKMPNELGLYDMSGNLWEWCWDIYAPYAEGAQTNPHGPVFGEECVIRGGSYYSSSAWCKVTARNSAVPTNSNYATIGFRCVKRVP
ncbi:MAG: hypothetical protein CVU50_05080 [Candidatus Cloacimonetes bacterium HGW-Cloacimonetes-3]|jgi:formylglycine-generating enzyme required for sulfatase activity|nr:MAG: hypothetical protein CVU50_05080 [Candidatus Cloacimonetes bacterium HGW-Cloacimonetes-3]